MFKFTVSLITADGYTFNYGFNTLQAAREWLAKCAAVLMPGERTELHAN